MDERGTKRYGIDFGLKRHRLFNDDLGAWAEEERSDMGGAMDQTGTHYLTASGFGSLDQRGMKRYGRGSVLNVRIPLRTQ